MNNHYLITRALNEEQVSQIREWLKVGDWYNGLDTFSECANPEVCTNIEYSHSNENYHNITSLVMETLNKNRDFHKFTIPLTSDPPLISKYSNGQSLKVHHDDPINGQFSTTIFLSDPSTYEGGELCLFINNKEEKIKLDAGYAIIYYTGIPHKVNPVTTGERIAFVFWTKTACNDPFIRDIYSDLCDLHKLIEKDDSVYDNFESFLSSPHFMIGEIINKILRKYTH
jgi:PKHD-type hydroxylase